MKTLFATILLATLASTAVAQPTPCDPCEPSQPSAQAVPATLPATTAQSSADPAPAATIAQPAGDEDGWHAPVGRRFFSGFRIGWTYIENYDKPTRDGGMSLKDEYGLKTPNMMLLGYEGFYRIIGHSWLNVLMVGNVTVAGLEQSKFIPAGSGLIGFEFNKNFQIGVGVNLTPDPQSPSHMIAAAGWTPMVGSIQTPVHFFYIPDASGNSRMGATVGMTW